jgi:hypothetical protein
LEATVREGSGSSSPADGDLVRQTLIRMDELQVVALCAGWGSQCARPPQQQQQKYLNHHDHGSVAPPQHHCSTEQSM